MADRLRLTILGCGSSPGVPRITGDWGACDPNEPRNRRRRTAAMIERIAPDGRTTRIVIDTGPDFRDQMVSAGVQRIDAVVFTHPHADHIHGVDDVRGFVLEQRRLMDIYADEPTLDRLKMAFGYCFETPSGSSYPPILIPHAIPHDRTFEVDGEAGPIVFEPLPQVHGEIISLGFRIDSIAYCPDVSSFPSETLERLADLDIFVVDALQYRPHPSHFSLTEALECIDALKPIRAILTHMHTPLDYATVMAQTPAHIEPAYDGMTIETVLSADWPRRSPD